MRNGRFLFYDALIRVKCHFYLVVGSARLDFLARLDEGLIFNCLRFLSKFDLLPLCGRKGPVVVVEVKLHLSLARVALQDLLISTGDSICMLIEAEHCNVLDARCPALL